MDTLIRIYLYFIGVIAVLICFITWVSIRLRAERINRIRIERERDKALREYGWLSKESLCKIEGLKHSNDTLNTIIEGQKVSIDSFKGTIKLNEERIEKQSEYIQTLEGRVIGLEEELETQTERLQSEINQSWEQNKHLIEEIDKLTDYANTLFKDLKGALEMNAKLMEATKGLEQVEQAGDESMDNWRNPIRSVTEIIRKKYAVEVNDDVERDEIFRLIDEDSNISRTFSYKEIDYEYPYCFAIGYDNDNRVSYSPARFFKKEGFAILPASDFIQPKKIETNTAGGRDWSVPQAFPEFYEIPFNTHVEICFGNLAPIGAKGVITDSKEGKTGRLFAFEFDGLVQWSRSIVFAPINPLDHPEHPQFNKK